MDSGVALSMSADALTDLTRVSALQPVLA